MESTSYRTHGCGQLRPEHIGAEVRIVGWVRRVRDLGRFVFVDVRDRSGILQLVALEGTPMYQVLRELGREWVIQASGVVRRRESPNPDLPTGEVEVEVKHIEILNRSQVPPFLIEDETDGQEELRLRYRYLDLRRPIQQRRLELRAEVIRVCREYLRSRGFLEVETPMLIRSTPEGARDFLVPSRLKPGTFYALPQSPQLLKQLLMVAGYDRYFQVARCFRDEDYRGDRQAEFTQLDCEMSFVTQEDVLSVFEGLVKEVFRTIKGIELEDFPRLTYAEAMQRYGSDKPDLRYSLSWEEVTQWAQKQGVPFWQGRRTFWLWVPQVKASRKQQDKWQALAKENGAETVAFIQQEKGQRSSSLAKYLSLDSIEMPGDGLGIWVTTEKLAALGAVRQAVIQDLALPPEKPWAMAWIVEFPLFEEGEDGRLSAAHHPFVHPHPADVERIETDPLTVRALAYDLVINGNEIMSGSIRCHTPELQMRIFRALGLSEEEARQKFGFLLEALSYGAPPHGGCAFGIDRWVMLLAGARSLREVIAFPKTASGSDLMLGAPAPIDPEQYAELLRWLSPKST